MGDRNGTTSNMGKQKSYWLEKYQVEDIVNDVSVTRTKFRLSTGKKNDKRKK